VFGNRFYGWKLGAALAVIATFGVLAGIRGERINPSLWRCLADPAETEGRKIWVPSARIVAVGDRDYRIRTGTVEVRVAGQAPAPAESRISLVAIFRRDGPSLEPLRSRILPGSDRTRRWMEVASVLVALGVLVNLARHFRFRPTLLQVERERP
jgi:hypothetical protein